MKTGTVYMFKTKGVKTTGEIVYRYGHTTKYKLDSRYSETEQKKVFLERLGFGGLNKPQEIILFKKVNDVTTAWNIIRQHIRSQSWHYAGKPAPILHQDAELGDKYFTSNDENFNNHIQTMLAPKLQPFTMA